MQRFRAWKIRYRSWKASKTKSRSKDSTLRGIARRKSDREKSNRKIATTKSLEFGKELIRTPNEKLTISSFFLLLFHLSTRWRRCQLLFIRLETKNTTFDDWYYTSVRDPRKTNVQQAKFRKNKRVMWGSKIGGSTRSVTVEKRRIGEGGNNKETEKDWTVLAFDELLLLHQDQRNGTRVAHRLFQLFVHYLDNIQSVKHALNIPLTIFQSHLCESHLDFTLPPLFVDR